MTDKALTAIVITLSLLGASVTAVAYMHNTFVNKDMFSLILEDLAQIKSDVRYLIKESER